MLREQVRILTADDLTKVVDRKEELYEVPEWGGALKLRSLSLSQRDEMMGKVTDNGRVDGKVDPVRIVRELVLYGVAEPPLTAEFLADKSYEVIDRIATAVMALNGMDKAAGLTASATFRPQPRPPVSVPPGEGPRANGGPPAAHHDGLGDAPLG